jgi:hypothetical protein
MIIVMSHGKWHVKNNFATVALQVHPSFVIELQPFFPFSTLHQLSEHITEAWIRHFIASFDLFEDCEGENWPKMALC